MIITDEIRSKCIDALFDKHEWDAQSRMNLLRSQHTNARRWRLTCRLLAKGKLTNDLVINLAKRNRQEPCEEKLLVEKRMLLEELKDPFSPLCNSIESIFQSHDDGRSAVDIAMREICTSEEENTESMIGLMNLVIATEMWSYYQAWSHVRMVQALEDKFDELEDIMVN